MCTAADLYDVKWLAAFTLFNYWNCADFFLQQIFSVKRNLPDLNFTSINSEKLKQQTVPHCLIHCVAILSRSKISNKIVDKIYIHTERPTRRKKRKHSESSKPQTAKTRFMRLRWDEILDWIECASWSIC